MHIKETKVIQFTDSKGGIFEIPYRRTVYVLCKMIQRYYSTHDGSQIDYTVYTRILKSTIKSAPSMPPVSNAQILEIYEDLTQNT